MLDYSNKTTIKNINNLIIHYPSEQVKEGMNKRIRNMATNFHSSLNKGTIVFC